MALKYENTHRAKRCEKCNRTTNENTKIKAISTKVDDSAEVKIRDVDSSKKFEKSEAKSFVSIPEAPKEYEDMLRQYEQDVRQHIQCE